MTNTLYTIGPLIKVSREGNFAEPSEAAEIGSMRITPIAQTPIAFALVACEGGVDLVESPIRHLGSFDYAAGLAATIEHDPALPWCRGVRLVFRAAGRGLNALDHEFEELIGKSGIAAESECAEVLIPSWDRLGHGTSRPSDNDGSARLWAAIGNGKRHLAHARQSAAPPGAAARPSAHRVAPPDGPNGGVADSFDEAKAAFREAGKSPLSQ
jgi:hypothetical protein